MEDLAVPTKGDKRRIKNGYAIAVVAPNCVEWTRLTNGSKRWTFQVQQGGKRREQTLRVRTRTEAKKEVERLKGVLASGGSLVTPTTLKMCDVYALWAERWEQKVTEGTRSRRTWELVSGRWAKYVEPVVGNVKVNDLTKTDVATVISKAKAQGKSTSLQDGLLDLLGGLCRFGIERDLMRSNPARALPEDDRPVVRDQRETYVLSQEEIDLLIESASEGWRLLFTVLQQSGLRISEALGLTWNDLDLTSDGAAIHVRHQLDRGTAVTLVPLKTTNSVRSIPLSDGLRRDLLTAKTASPIEGIVALKQSDTLVFASASGSSPGYSNAYRAFKQALKRSEINTRGKRCSPHGLRHAFGTRLLMAGFPVDAVSRLMGHANPTITSNIYSHTLQALHASGELQGRFEAAFGGRS
jgi:integrase